MTIEGSTYPPSDRITKSKSGNRQLASINLAADERSICPSKNTTPRSSRTLIRALSWCRYESSSARRSLQTSCRRSALDSPSRVWNERDLFVNSSNETSTAPIVTESNKSKGRRRIFADASAEFSDTFRLLKEHSAIRYRMCLEDTLRNHLPKSSCARRPVHKDHT